MAAQPKIGEGSDGQRPPLKSTVKDPVVSPVARSCPCRSPPLSRPASTLASSTGVHYGVSGTANSYFHSRRVHPGHVERPWLHEKDPKDKWTWIIPTLGLVAGLVIAAFLVWDGIRAAENYSYCLVLDDDFSRGLNPKIWTKEAEVGGFGNGQFEETTTGDENVYIEDGSLIIKPTLQNATLIESNSVINLTSKRICTSNRPTDCIAATNVTNGTIVNPVKSGRLNTKIGASIRYGKVEVTATLPIGDWMWPAIWLLPVKNRFGTWPRSGEIDMIESRGNNFTYSTGGNNVISSALHWGPDAENDAWWRTNSKRKVPLSTYSEKPHLFGLEWSESHIMTYVDSRILQIMYFDFGGSLYSRGHFALTDSNGTSLTDPWSHTGKPSTPFDEDFYLILNVAVGGTNGWFEDGKHGKPWVDGSHTARKEFWEARSRWLPTWEKQGSFKIDRVKMWQMKGHNGC